MGGKRIAQGLVKSLVLFIDSTYAQCPVRSYVVFTGMGIVDKYDIGLVKKGIGVE
ncbi:hypothetical protein D3C78_1689650 [compost metagenome]